MGCFALILVLAFVLWLFSIDSALGWIGVVGLVVAGIVLAVKDQQKKDEEITSRKYGINDILERLKQEESIVLSQKYFSDSMESGIGIDEENKKVVLLYNQDGVSEGKVFSYRDILKSEVIEDDVSVTNTSRTSQIGGAILGGLLAGGVGAIIGGLSGSTNSSKEVFKIDLRITANDTQKPVYTINFLTADILDFNGKPFPIKKDDQKYKLSAEKVNHWYALISVLIKQADEEDRVKVVESSNNTTTIIQENLSNISVADELQKLHELLKQNIITQEEFDKQKLKILSL